MSLKLKSTFAALFAVALLAGCEAQGVDPSLIGGGGGGNTPPPDSVGDTRNCEVAVSGLCVLRGEGNSGEGLVDALLDSDGPLGPIAGDIDTAELEDALVTLLRNDADLVELLTNLTVEGQLQEGLTVLLLGDEGDGMGALAETLTNLLLPNEDGSPNGLIALFGLGDEDGGGAVGFLQALLIDGTDTGACQAPLGTLCLISGNGSQTGLVDLLITSGGLGGAVSPTLTQEATDELVATLGDVLASDGSIAGLVTGLIQEGHLADGLQVLLMGTDDEPGLVTLLQGLTGNLGDILGEVGDFLGGLFPLGGVGAP